MHVIVDEKAIEFRKVEFQILSIAKRRLNCEKLNSRQQIGRIDQNLGFSPVIVKGQKTTSHTLIALVDSIEHYSPEKVSIMKESQQGVSINFMSRIMSRIGIHNFFRSFICTEKFVHDKLQNTTVSHENRNYYVCKIKTTIVLSLRQSFVVL